MGLFTEIEPNRLYMSCLHMNEDEKMQYDKAVGLCKNPAELPFHRMSTYRPQCRSLCPVGKSCEKLWMDF